MTDRKYYLLAEFDVKPESLEETKAIFSKLLPKVLEEEGCEEMYTTSILDEPNKLVFFEVFSSREAHDWHMEQPYTRQLATDLDGKLAAPPKITELSRF
ncbi:putative quinol monooxygenase [Silvibacterium acidisoli]|uniref:putative quinol monooxygenase n=1 Tax=Acidobacteriaceae bacterium ZG23-2 TaxID=2883246 RepID=UPI00406C57B8